MSIVLMLQIKNYMWVLFNSDETVIFINAEEEKQLTWKVKHHPLLLPPWPML